MTSPAADTFRAAFAPYRAELEAAGAARLRRLHAEGRAAEKSSRVSVYNHPSYARLWSNTMKYLEENRGHVWDRDSRSYSPDDYVLVEEKLSAFCAKWAAAELEDAALKLAAKVADLTEVSVSHVSGNGAWFTVNGKRGADYVRVEQSQIVNVSSRGTIFNQWPSLIYVNGKKVSEAAYKRG